MKTNLLPTPKDLTLDQINQHFADDETAREYIEAILWPKGPVCPHCKNRKQDRIWKIEANPIKKIRSGLHRCAECNKEFTVTISTIFEDSHIPLRKWLIAWYMVCSSKKGISSLQLQRNLGLGSYRTALFMTHRIRHAIQVMQMELLYDQNPLQIETVAKREAGDFPVVFRENPRGWRAADFVHRPGRVGSASGGGKSAENRFGAREGNGGAVAAEKPA